MTDPIIKLAQDLEWLGCELEYYGHKHALEGFPGSGPTWATFVEKQKGVLETAEKVERQLKGAVRYNPTALVGVNYPLKDTLDSVADLMTAVEEIKESAVYSVPELPARVREFSRIIREEFSEPESAG
jgi:hypothetical protein